MNHGESLETMRHLKLPWLKVYSGSNAKELPVGISVG
jgi:hypothetical protein